MIGELKGKIIGMRVLSTDCCPKMESTFQDVGKILNIEVKDIGTFWSIFKEDGGYYGEGQGILMTNDGEIVSWKGQGLGWMNGKITEYRASLFFNTSSKQLERLNKIMGIVEYSIDEEGNTLEKLWEWV